jgi:hypothetical protein
MAQATHCAKKRAQQSVLKLTETYNNSNGFPSNNRGFIDPKGFNKTPDGFIPSAKEKKIKKNIDKIVFQNITNNCTVHLFYLTVLNYK